MKKYDVTLTAHYEKTVAVYADSPEQAKEKIETVLFDTDLIGFSDEDFVCGEAEICVPCEDESGEEEGCEDGDMEDESPYLRHHCGRLGGCRGNRHYLPYRAACRLGVRHFLFGRGLWKRYDHADRGTGNQHRLR